MAEAVKKTIEGGDLAAIVADEIRSAISYDDSELANKRSLALEYIQGRMRDLKTLPNRSLQVSRDVADTISWMVPGIVRTFIASDSMVRYEATKSGGDQWAQDASEFTNYDFMRNNDGYRILRNTTYDSLALGNGVVASYWKPIETKRETLRKLTMEDVALLSEDEDVTILTAKERDETYDTETMDEIGQPIIIPQPYIDVKVERITSKGRIVDKTCKPECLLLNDTATTIEDARAVGYEHTEITRSDLMEMADEFDFDKGTIEELPADSDYNDNEVSEARDFDRVIDAQSPVRSMDRIKLYEYYIYADVDDDGIAEHLQVWYAGSKVLAWSVWEDDIPYTDIPCYPVPHRWDADSVSDKTMDIQRVKTVLTRGLLDNMYAVALPQREVEVGTVLNPDALVNPRFGGILWKKVGSNSTAPIIDHVAPFIGDKLLLGMNYMDDMKSMRTGVSRQTMALDPEALNNQTATAAQQQKDASVSQVELVARDMAEFGWSKFFAKRLRLAVKYLQIATIPDTEDKDAFREVQPMQWDDDMAVTIDTGLGTGSRDRDMAMLKVVLDTQIGMAERLGAVPGGQVKALEFIPKIFDTATKLVSASGMRNAETYFPKVTDEDVKKMAEDAAAAAQQPNPAIELEQMKMQGAQQLEQVKGQTQAQLKQVDARVSMQQAQLKAEGDVVKNQAELDADMATASAQRETDLMIETLKQDREDARFYADLAMRRELELLKLSSANQNAQANRDAAASAPQTN